MTHIVEIVIWWVGAVVVLLALAAISIILVLCLKYLAELSWAKTLRLMQLSTARYWVQRMEREGLTVCRSAYRQFVAERNPKTVNDYARLEAEAAKAEKGGDHGAN